jgi:hypothetical protein
MWRGQAAGKTDSCHTRFPGTKAYDMNAAIMSLGQHERGIHAV